MKTPVALTRLAGGWDSTRLFQVFGVARQLTTIGIAVALAKSGISLEEIGIYEQLFFLGYLLTFFWMDGLVRGYMAMAGTLPKERRQSFLSGVAGTVLALSMVLALGSLILAPPLIDLFAGGGIPKGHWLLFSGFIFSYQASMLVEHVLLLRRDNATQWRWMGISTAGLFLSLMVPIWMSGRLESGLNGLLVFGVFRLAVLILVCRPRIPVKTDMPELRAWWGLSAPLIAYAITAGGALVLDGWIINAWFRDPEVFAVYRYGARELPFTTVLAGATGTVFISRLASGWVSALPDLRIRTRQLLHLFFPLTILFMIVSEPLFEWVFRVELGPASEIFRIYLFILVSRFVLSGSLLTARGATGFMLRVGLMELAINAALSLVLVRYWGISGVAWATVAAYSFEKVVHIWWLRRSWGVRPGDFIPLSLWTAYSILLILAYVMVRLWPVI
jgi:peptidoglycan biosynthesis protein MviN/MurJ (putative lipid II flippase)